MSYESWKKGYELYEKMDVTKLPRAELERMAKLEICMQLFALQSLKEEWRLNYERWRKEKGIVKSAEEIQSEKRTERMGKRFLAATKKNSK